MPRYLNSITEQYKRKGLKREEGGGELTRFVEISFPCTLLRLDDWRLVLRHAWIVSTELHHFGYNTWGIETGLRPSTLNLGEKQDSLVCMPSIGALSVLTDVGLASLSSNCLLFPWMTVVCLASIEDSFEIPSRE